jgi:hypothetical protein
MTENDVGEFMEGGSGGDGNGGGKPPTQRSELVNLSTRSGEAQVPGKLVSESRVGGVRRTA